jgi:hypothetical protein
LDLLAIQAGWVFYLRSPCCNWHDDLLPLAIGNMMKVVHQKIIVVNIGINNFLCKKNRMRFFITVIAITAISHFSFAQQSPADTFPKKKFVIDTAAIYDSLEKEFADLFGSQAPKSYLEACIGFSNQVFSLQNSFLNATQANGTLVIKPGVTYYHKSGLSLSAEVYMADFNKYQLYQAALTAGYDLVKSKTLSLGASFTHYFAMGDSIAKRSAPYENEAYAYFGLKKTWLRPGINIGWAGGGYSRSIYLDSLQRWLPFDTKLNDVSVSVNISHEFSKKKILFRKDECSLTPTLMLNAGQFSSTTKASRAYIEQHPLLANIIRNYINNRPLLRRFIRKQNYSSDFSIQSASLMLNLDYSVGDLTISPQWLIDYYLKETTESRVNNIFSVNICYSF